LLPSFCYLNSETPIFFYFHYYYLKKKKKKKEEEEEEEEEKNDKERCGLYIILLHYCVIRGYQKINK
jgi:hypothetical protein